MRLLIVVALLGLGLAEKVRYDGYQTWELALNSGEDAHFLMDLHQQNLILDISGALRRGGMAEITVGPKHSRMIATMLRKRDIAVAVKVDDLQQLIDAEEQAIESNHVRTKTGALAYDPNSFNTVEDNYSHMQDYVDSCASRGLVCSVENAGNSYEGRPINIYKVGTGGNNPIIWIDSAVHAREWLSITTTVRIFDYVIENFGIFNDVTDLLNRYDVYFMPIGNPDGYSYSWTNDRMYRKNRRPIPGSICTGVDLNRNFDYNWCRQGASTSPCSDTYCGTSGASEPETQAYQSAVLSVADRMATLITLHTYGQMWMHPWGNTVGFSTFNPCERADDHDDMYSASEAAADAIFQESGRRWDYGTSCEVIYFTTGASDDWAKGVAGVKYSYNPELRSTFIAPVSEIEPSYREVWRAIVGQMERIEEIEGPNFPLNK